MIKSFLGIKSEPKKENFSDFMDELQKEGFF